MGRGNPIAGCVLKRWAVILAATIIGFWQLPAEAKSPALPAKKPADAFRDDPAPFTAPIPWDALYASALLGEFRGVKIPSLRYIGLVAQCETGRDTAHVGNTAAGHTYRGAFGFYTQQGGRGGTWDQWGGWEFAPYAEQADYWQQVVIFLRVHITGFYDYRPDKLKWWPPAGLSVNNCSRFAAPLDWVLW